MMLSVVGLMACSRQYPEPVLLPPPATSPDSTLRWLRNPVSVKSAEYHQVWAQRVTLHLQASRFDDAAETLTGVGHALNRAKTYHAGYLGILLQTLRAHKARLSPEAYTGLAYHAGLQYLIGRPERKDSALFWLNQARQPGPASYVLVRNQANALTVLATLYGNLGKADTALHTGYQALDMYRQLRDTVNVGLAWQSLSAIYRSVFAFREAGRCLDSAQLIAYTKKDTNSLYYILFNKQMIQQSIIGHEALIHSPEFAASYFAYTDSLLALYQQMKQKTAFHRFNVYYSLAVKGLYLGQPTLTARALDSCRTAAANLNHAVSRQNFRLLELFCNSNKQNNNHLFIIIDSLSNNKNYKEAYLYSTTLYRDARKQANAPLALRSLEAAYRNRDSLWNQEQRGRLFELEKQYETTRNQQQLALQQAQLQQQRA